MSGQEKKTWDEVLDALENTHTLSIKDVCMILKCSRNWANKYVLPYCDKIYLNSNIRDDSPEGINWILRASIILQKRMTESVWVNTQEFYNLINNSIGAATIQTKKIPVEFLMKDADSYIKGYNELMQMKKDLLSDKNVSVSQIIEMKEKINEHFFSNLSELGETLIGKQAKITERGKIERIHVDMDIIDINNWVAPHDVKEYGDTDEKVYRHFFKHGYIRVELSIGDIKTGEISKKVYYLPDPEELTSKIDEYVIISYGDYLEYQDHLKSREV